MKNTITASSSTLLSLFLLALVDVSHGFMVVTPFHVSPMTRSKNPAAAGGAGGQCIKPYSGVGPLYSNVERNKTIIIEPAPPGFLPKPVALTSPPNSNRVLIGQRVGFSIRGDSKDLIIDVGTELVRGDENFLVKTGTLNETQLEPINSITLQLNQETLIFPPAPLPVQTLVSINGSKATIDYIVDPTELDRFRLLDPDVSFASFAFDPIEGPKLLEGDEKEVSFSVFGDDDLADFDDIIAASDIINRPLSADLPPTVKFEVGPKPSFLTGLERLFRRTPASPQQPTSNPEEDRLLPLQFDFSVREERRGGERESTPDALNIKAGLLAARFLADVGFFSKTELNITDDLQRITINLYEEAQKQEQQQTIPLRRVSTELVQDDRSDAVVISYFSDDPANVPSTKIVRLESSVKEVTFRVLDFRGLKDKPVNVKFEVGPKKPGVLTRVKQLFSRG